MSDWGFPNPATPPGSSLYYVVRFAPPGQRDRLAALFALRAKWQTQAHSVSDPGVARLQLGWWQEELERLAQGQAKHPALLSLLPVAAEPAFIATFRRLLGTVDHDLRGLQFHSPAELDHYCRDSGGSLVRLMLLSQEVEPDAEWPESLGRGLRLVELLQQLPQELHRGRCPLPQAWLTQAGVTIGQLHKGHDPAAVKLLDHALQQASDWLQQAEPDGPWPNGSLQRWWRMQRAWVKTVKAEPEEILTHLVELTPLRRLWLCLGARG